MHLTVHLSTQQEFHSARCILQCSVGKSTDPPFGVCYALVPAAVAMDFNSYIYIYNV